MATPTEPRAEAYRDAASNRCADALALLEAGQFAGAIWLSGVALECLFQGYHRRWSDQLDTGHDLKSLYKASRFGEHIAEKHAGRIAAAVGEVTRTWRHRYRYDPPVAVERMLGTRTPADLARLARLIVGRAQEVVTYGVSRWSIQR